MNLIIFDIDGTIVDSINADDHCFIQTFKELHQIDLGNVDWTDFKNITDSGLTIEIFDRWLNRKPAITEIDKIKRHFYRLLHQRDDDFKEINGAIRFINKLKKSTHFEIAFATGGWKETALLKTMSIQLDLKIEVLTSANDHYNRAKITELAIRKSLAKNNLSQFENVTYFGDGLWDLKTTQEMGINFIGVDFHENGKLKTAGASKIISNYLNVDKIMNWI